MLDRQEKVVIPDFVEVVIDLYPTTIRFPSDRGSCDKKRAVKPFRHASK
jgi:hypothetical protein